MPPLEDPFPAEQPVQAAEPAANEYVEAAQSVHVEDADDEYRPARQSSHVEDEVAPAVVLYLPLGKWGGVWGVLARFEEIDDVFVANFFCTKGEIPGLVENAATHLAHFPLQTACPVK